jgi:hypothetical protein
MASERTTMGIIIMVVVMVLMIIMAVAYLQHIWHWINTTFCRSVSILVPSVAIENPDASITITVTAVGCDVTIQGLAVNSPSGVIATVGQVPSGVRSTAQSCSLVSIYTGGKSYMSLPVTIQTGQSATIILSPGCQNAISVTIFYNNGKSINITVG